MAHKLSEKEILVNRLADYYEKHPADLKKDLKELGVWKGK